MRKILAVVLLLMVFASPAFAARRIRHANHHYDHHIHHKNHHPHHA